MNIAPGSGDVDHRFAPITDNNRSGYLWIASILCLIYSTLILIARLHIKWNLYGADDALATLATAMQLGEVISLFLAMNRGLGKSENVLDASQLADTGKATFASQVFLILALTLSKASVAALMLRLFTKDMKAIRKTWFLCTATLVLVVAWGIGSILALSLYCSPPRFIRDTSSQCGDQLLRWRIITAVDMFTELLLVLLPALIVWPIQMKFYIKIQVVFAFGFRLPVMGLAAAHLHFVRGYVNTNDVSKAMIPALVYQQFELFWSLLAATIPTLKSFMRSFNSGFGMEIETDGYYSSAYGYGNGSNGIYPLQSLQSASASANPTMITRQTNFGGDSASRNTAINTRSMEASTVPDRKARVVSAASDGSRELIIRREVQ